MKQIAQECGVTRPILDTAATPLGLGSAGSFRHILACKAIHGLPCGGAYHNMTVSWTWLKRWRKNGLAQIYEGREALAEQMFHHYYERIRQPARDYSGVCRVRAGVPLLHGGRRHAARSEVCAPPSRYGRENGPSHLVGGGKSTAVCFTVSGSHGGTCQLSVRRAFAPVSCNRMTA